MERLVHNVAELHPAARLAVEGLVGHALRDDQRIYIAALDAVLEPRDAQRRGAWRELREIIDEMHQHAGQSGVGVSEIERTIDEACDEVRYGK